MNTPPGVPPPPAAGGRYVTVQVPRVRPFITYVIMGLTIFVFVLQVVSTYTLGVDLPQGLGLKVNELILQGQLWRLLTPMLLHGSILHIAFNMYALYALGPGLESSYGHGRFLTLYLVSGFAGNVMSFLFSAAPSLGSSTAIFGLIGAEGVFLFRNRQIFGQRAQRALANVIFIAAANLLFGLTAGSQIDNWGHIGGLLGGTFYAWFAGPLYSLAGDFQYPRLEDQHTNVSMISAALVDVLIFCGLAAMKFVRGF